jgi:HD superfamily phosphodiesterase
MSHDLVNNFDLTSLKKITSMNLEDIPSTQDFDRSGLLKRVLAQFKISRVGHHGTGHWARVRWHGLKVGGLRGADLLVVEIYAFLHDSQRRNEYSDPHIALGYLLPKLFREKKSVT